MIKRLKTALPSALLILGVLAVWEALVRVFGVPKYVLPAPTDVFAALLGLPNLLTHLGATLFEAALGLLLAALIAFALALAMDAFSAFKRAVYPLLIASQTVPVVVLAPLLLLYLGFGYAPKIATVILMCFFPIALNMTHALESVPETMLNGLRMMGANKRQLYRYAKLPASLPGFFSGLRIAATYSVMGAVVGEWLGGDRGLGFLMLRLKSAYALDRVFAVILYIVIMSFVLFFAARAPEALYKRKFKRKRSIEQ